MKDYITDPESWWLPMDNSNHSINVAIATVKSLTAIEHLIRIYYSPERFDFNDHALQFLRQNDLIVPTGHWFSVTPKGRVYVEAIREIPLPVSVTEWRIPR